MSKVCEEANRVQLMSSGSECSNWLSLAYFHCIFFSSSPFLCCDSSPSVPQPLLPPSFSGSQLCEGVRARASERVSTLEAVNNLSTPAERWHLDVLDSKLLLFHDATRCNYSNIFVRYPAVTATVKRRSWRNAGGAETSVLQSLPDLCGDRLTDRSWVGGEQIEDSWSHSNMAKDLVNSCIRFKFLSLAPLRRLFGGLLTDSANVVERCCCCSLDAGTASCC